MLSEETKQAMLFGSDWAKFIAEEDAKKPKKRKAIPIPLTEQQKYIYRLAHELWQKKNTPEAVKDHGLVPVKYPKINGASGLQTYCENLFNWTGHHLERTATQGVWDKKMNGGKGGYRKSAGTIGSVDDKGHYCNPNFKFPIPVYIEVKFGKDTESDKQEKYQRKVTSTGALHCIVRTPQDIIEFMYYLKNIRP